MGAKSVSKETLEKYDEVLKWVTTMVKPGFVAGTTYMTLADISFMATYSTLKAIGKFIEKRISTYSVSLRDSAF